MIIGSISNLLLISKTNRILFGRQPDSDVTPHQRKLPQARSIKRIVIESIPRLPREEPFHSIKKKVEESSSTAIIANDQSKKDDFFSFCLLIKDDNDILNEWIAYHYHTIKLRKLIVAVDPSSKTSPLEILQIWQKFFGLEFEIWNDKDFMPDYFLDGQYENVPRMIKVEDKNATKWQDDKDAADEEHLRQDYVEINNHRYRQAKFLQACSKSLQLANNTWTTHIDTDEYIVVNPTLRQYEKVGINETVPVPTTLESGTIFNFLQDLLVDDKVVINWPCISMPRVLYGSLEDPYDEKDDKIVFDTFRRSRFESLRWKYHVAYDNATLNKQPKVIMDMSGFPPFNITRKAFSIHRPNMQLCRRQTQMDVENNWRYPLTVNHYVGSLERYNARDDPRRTQNVSTRCVKVVCVY